MRWTQAHPSCRNVELWPRKSTSRTPSSKGENSVRNRATLAAMNLAVRKPMSLAEFLVWEESQELRYEFDGVLPIAMTGGAACHATIQRNLVLAVGGRLRGKS